MDSIADKLIVHGWTQHQSHGDNGEVCLGAAISLATEKDSMEVFGAMAACVVLGVHGAPIMISVWNDTPGRTFDEVLRVAKEVDELMQKEYPDA